MYQSTSSNYNSPVGMFPNSLETVDEELTVLRKALHDLGHKIKSADHLSMCSQFYISFIRFLEEWGTFITSIFVFLWFVWLIRNPCEENEDATSTTNENSSIFCASDDLNISPLLICFCLISIICIIIFIGYRFMELRRNLYLLNESGKNLLTRLISVIAVATRNSNSDPNIRLESEAMIRHVHRYLLLGQTLHLTHELCGSNMKSFTTPSSLGDFRHNGRSLALSRPALLESEGLVLAMEENLLTSGEADFFAQGDSPSNIMALVVYGWLSTLIQRLACNGFFGSYPIESTPVLSSLMVSVDNLQTACSRIQQLSASEIPLGMRFITISLMITLMIQGLIFSAASIVQAYHDDEILIVICAFIGSIIFIIVCLTISSLGGRPSLKFSVLGGVSPKAYMAAISIETESVLDAMLVSVNAHDVIPRVRMMNNSILGTLSNGHKNP